MTVTVPDHAPLRQAEEGCLAMADISGYTAYLAGSELDHAQDVLADLTETVVNALAPPMRLSKLEGDAAFVYAPGVQIDASMLLDTVEATYFAFRRRQDAIDRATSCECNACVLIPRLDLKFVAHHGRFVRQRVAGSEELSGSDVIVVHRLLKNTVAESLGHAAYAFYTDSMVAAMSVSPEVLGWQRHGEEVADIGPVQGWVADLHAAWAAERERRRVKISPEESRQVAGGHVARRPEGGRRPPRHRHHQPLRPRQGCQPGGGPGLAAVRLLHDPDLHPGTDAGAGPDDHGAGRDAGRHAADPLHRAGAGCGPVAPLPRHPRRVPTPHGRWNERPGRAPGADP